MPRPLLAGKLLTTQSVIETAGYLPEVTGSKAEGTLIVVTFSAGSAGGVVIIEGAATESFTGTWAVLATITWAAASRAHETFISGAYLARRARISTAIVTGTVDVDFLITG